MKRFTALALAMLALGGCNQSAVQCASEDAQAPVISIVKEQIEKLTQQQVRGEDGRAAVPVGKIRAVLQQLNISLGDIRTSKEDPNSTKRFCEGTLNVRFPADMLEAANETRQLAGYGSVSDLAEQADIERRADTFSVSIEFNVQPTDDGSKVYAETETGNGMFAFAGEVLASGLLKAAIQEAQRESALAEQQQAAMENAARQQSLEADLELAKHENQLANQTINTLWSTLHQDVRSRLLPSQRAWVKKKDADCKLEAASATVETLEMESARLNCDTRLTQDRINYLQQYRSYQPLATPEEQEPGPEGIY